jgi:CHASE3 domain sensor protein
MAQQKRIVQNKISRREQERINARKESSRNSFSTIAMRVFIVLILAAMIIGLAIQIIVYN